MPKSEQEKIPGLDAGDSPQSISAAIFNMVKGMLGAAGQKAKPPVALARGLSAGAPRPDFEPMDISPAPPPKTSQEVLGDILKGQDIDYRGFKAGPGKEGSVRLDPKGWNQRSGYTGPEGSFEFPEDNNLVPMGANLFANKEIAEYPGLRDMLDPYMQKYWEETQPKKKGR